jgi:hypothetical protein
MLQLRCTAKVQHELGIKPNELAEARVGDSLLGNWCVNLFTVDRRKTLIFVNEKTLLSFVIFGVKKSNVKKTPEIFLRGLDQLLTIEGIDLSDINKVFKGYDAYEFTKTTSRSLLGNMNDLVDLYRHYILYDGGFNYVNIGEVIMRINRTPQRNLGWSNSIEIVKELLGGVAGKDT